MAHFFVSDVMALTNQLRNFIKLADDNSAAVFPELFFSISGEQC
jgi:hypothetical protein